MSASGGPSASARSYDFSASRAGSKTTVRGGMPRSSWFLRSRASRRCRFPWSTSRVRRRVSPRATPRHRLSPALGVARASARMPPRSAAARISAEYSLGSGNVEGPADHAGDGGDLRRQLEHLLGQERLRAVAERLVGLVVDLD